MSFAGKILRGIPSDTTPHDKKRGRTHVWKCVYDPSGSQAFLGNFFRTIDVTEGGFPEGTVFENIKTGEKSTYFTED